MFRAFVAFAVLFGLLAPVTAAPPRTKADPDPKSLRVPAEELSKARELVQKLGSEAFHERETAERDLAAMGRFARLALLDGVNLDPDPEVRARCRLLLPRANAEELSARLDAFLADTEGKFDHDLPGWHKLRAVVRGEWEILGHTFAARPTADRAARELFIEFIKTPGGKKLLTALGGPPGELGQLVAARKTELYQMKYPRGSGGTPRNPTVTEVAVVVFAESQVHSRSVPRSSPLTTVLTTSGIQGALQGGDERAAALRAVMNAWFDSRVDAPDLYSALALANNLKNDEAAGRLAGRILNTAGIQGYYKGQALMTLVRLKDADHLAAIEKSFTDSTALTTTVKIVNGMQVRQTIEVRDAALAAALVLTGQNPEDYGFDAFPKGGPPGANFSYAWAKIHEDKRKEAFEKWGAWRERNP
ncbi:MAG: hypothetical protein J0I06_22685 [Planctomycetes bacterium]|nr:hypothetical protein [Planctomycetota bacterium]